MPSSTARRAFETPIPPRLVERFLGIPWVLNGAQQTGADCWGLVRLVYASQGVAIDHPSDMGSARAAEIARRFAELRELVLGDIAFEPAEAPWLDWDVLEMAHEADAPNHVGVVCHFAGEPMVLHSRRGVGAHLTAIARLPHRIERGWRHV